VKNVSLSPTLDGESGFSSALASGNGKSRNGSGFLCFRLGDEDGDAEDVTMLPMSQIQSGVTGYRIQQHEENTRS
jgi:hypothetical protein